MACICASVQTQLGTGPVQIRATACTSVTINCCTTLVVCWFCVPCIVLSDWDLVLLLLAASIFAPLSSLGAL